MTTNKYGRDNGIQTGSFRNIDGNDGRPILIGNVMEIFRDETIYAVDIDIDSASEIGTPFFASIMIYNEELGDFDYIDQTVDYIIEADDLDNTVNLTLIEPINIETGDVLLVALAKYEISPIWFKTAQPVEYGTVVGYVDSELFSLSSPKAIMVRLVLEEYVAVEDIAASFNISQNMPNPFNGNTRINYSLLASGNVSIEFVDVTGKLVQSINKGVQNAGDYNIVVDASNFAEGIYFYTFTVGNEKITKRMVVTK